MSIFAKILTMWCPRNLTEAAEALAFSALAGALEYLLTGRRR
jgi:hypothetical protein